MCNDFTDMQCVNKDFMDYGYAMRNDFKDMQSVTHTWKLTDMLCVNHEFMNYGYTMCNDFMDMQCVMTLRITDMESVNQAPYVTFLFLRIWNP